MELRLRTLATGLICLAVGACTAAPVAAPAPAATTSAPAPTVSTPVVASERVAPDIANRALAGRAHETGRADVAICLYVDPTTGLDVNAALLSAQGSVDALVRQGYTVLGARALVSCPQAPLFLRTTTVHPKNSGSGGVVGTATRVTTPSPILLFVAVTTLNSISRIFGGLTVRRGAEEMICTGDNCGEVTGSIYTDPTSFASAVARESLILEGFGLVGSGK